jgi:DNA-binding response OmpR family regulator
MHVLIVEDDPGIARFLERGLAAHGHRSVSADNGHDGVIMAADESVDFVLLDIMLPPATRCATRSGLWTAEPMTT